MSNRFKQTHRTIAMLLGTCLLLFASVSSYASLSPGTGSFVWDDATGASDPDKPLKVYYYRPTVITTDTPDFNADTPAIDSFPTSGLDTFLGKRMAVLLGDEDTLRTSNLRQATQADAEGQTRFERGNFFFAEGQAEAAIRAVDFGCGA